MKMLKCNTRKNRLIKKLQSTVSNLVRENNKLKSHLDLMERESFDWKEDKEKLLDYKLQYYWLLENLNLNQKEAEKVINIIVDPKVWNFYARSNKY